mgnify:CR=1 FL=1
MYQIIPVCAKAYQSIPECAKVYQSVSECTRVYQSVPGGVWYIAVRYFSISKALSQKIERVQKACLYIILGRHATSDYFCNLAMLNLEPLANRREVLSNKFARKTVKHPAHSQMFTFANRHNARSGRKVIEPTAKTARYRKSSIPSLAKLINAM